MFATVHYITHNGETLPIPAWAKRLDITHQALRSRIASGWSIEAAVTTKRRRKRKLKPSVYIHNGQRLTMAQMSQLSGISPQAIRGRLKQGWTISAALSLPLRRGGGERRCEERAVRGRGTA